MRKNEVRLGGRYQARVSGELQTVQLIRQHPQGGWEARNERTGRLIRVRTAGRLRPLPERQS